MKKLLKFLEANRIEHKQHNKKMVIIGGEKFELIKPDDDGKIFTPSFTLMADSTKAENYVFSFGGNYYFTPEGTEDDPKLNNLRYYGKCSEKQKNKSFLGVRGGFEILNGSGQYKDWVKKAKFLGLETLGICEKNTLAGALKFQSACKSGGIESIIGETVTVFRKSEDLRYDLKLYVKNEKGYRNLLLINKKINVDELSFIKEEDLFKMLDGLYIVLDPKSLPYEKVFPIDLDNDVFYQIDPVIWEDNEVDKTYLENLKQYVLEKRFKPIAIWDAFYLEKDHNHIKQILNGIAKKFEYISKDQWFKTWGEYESGCSDIFSEERIGILKKAKKNLELVASVCKNFNIPTGERHLPKYKMTKKEAKKYKTNKDLFWGLVEDGLKRKTPKGKKKEYLKRVEIEWDVIEYGDVMDYFLILYDIIKWCRKKNILVGIGRGSAGGSLVSYLLDITQLDPIEYGLLFERFLNKGRIEKSLPDIDVDFPAKKRGLIKAYIEKRYGHDQVCSVGTYTALQLRAALKDIARQYSIPFDETNRVTAYLEGCKSLEDIFRKSASDKFVYTFVSKYPYVINDIPLVLGQPKAKSIHACAMMVFPKEKTMYEWAPVREQDGQIVSEWEGNELDEAGFLKEDILGVKQLDKYEDILESIKKVEGKEIDLYSLKLNHDKCYKYFQKGWNGDVFHFGSRGLTGYCKELLPEDINDLIAGISLYRPGAMENNFHNEYVLRKNGDREVEYFVGSEEILKDTYGVFVYQEQIMKLCQVLGGLSLVEADDVRKAMVKKKYEALQQYKVRFIPHYVKEFGVSKQYAEGVWEAIDKAATYLFNKSHASAYSITGYWGQYLKVFYPVHYWKTAINYADEDQFPHYINEVHKTGDIEIKPPDINESGEGVTADFKANKIYWSIGGIKNVGGTALHQIIEDRKKSGEYFDLKEFYSRHKFTGTKVNKRTIECLILSGAFDQVCDIDLPKRRFKLIEEFREIGKIKIDDEKDLFSANKSMLKDNQWWVFQQKLLSGIAYFDYKDLCGRLEVEGYKFMNPEKFMRENSAGKDARIGGYISEIKLRKNQKGQWASIVLESNYEFIRVQIWPEQFSRLEGRIHSKSKAVIVLNGKIKFDEKYSKENNLQTTEDTEFLVLE